MGACVVFRLARRGRAAAAAVRARVRPPVDVALAAVDSTHTAYVMRGAFRCQHLLAQARRRLAHTLRGRPHRPGLDEAIVQTAIGGYTRPVGRGRMMTADLWALYPRETGDQAVLRPLTRARSRPRYDRARLASAALTARVQAERRSRRLNSRSLPLTVTAAGPPARSGLDRGRSRTAGTGREASHLQEQDGHLLEHETDLAALEDSSHLIEAAAALLKNGARQRAALTQSAPAAAPTHTQQPHAPQPGTQIPGPGTPTGGIA